MESLARTKNRDLLVVQKREVAKLAYRLRMRALGLTGTGTARVLASRSALVRRILLHLDSVEVRPLAESASRVAFAAPKRDTSVVQRDYHVRGGTGLQVELDGGERLNAEPSPGEFSLAWTTGLPAEVLLSRLGPLVDEQSQTALIVNTAGEFDEQKLLVAEALTRLNAAAEAPEFWRMDLDDRSLTWERGEPVVYPGGPPLGLMGFIGCAYDEGYLQQLVRATATPMIGTNARALLDRCAPVIETAAVPRVDYAR